MSEQSKYAKLAKNSIIFAIANFGSNVLRFIIVPFYTYYLTTSEYGIVDTLTTTVSLVMPVMLLAIQEAVLRFTLDKEKDPSSVLKSSLAIFLCGSILFLLGYFPFSQFRIFEGLWWYFYFLLLSNALNNILLNYTRGSGKSITFMFGGIINTFVMLVCNVLLIAVYQKGLPGYIISLIAGYSVSTLFLFVSMRPIDTLKKGNIDFGLLKNMLRYSIPLIPTAAMWWIMNVADRYSITYFLGVSYTGIYAISHKVPTIITMFYAIFQQAWQISAVEESTASDRSKFYENIYDMFFRALFLVASIVILFIRPLITLVVDPSYIDSWRYAPILVISAVFSSMAGFLGVNYVVSQKTVGALTTSALGAIVNIVFNIIFIPVWGVQGAAIATLIGFYSVWLVRATISNGGVKIKQNFVAVHMLLALVISQSILLILDFKYQYIVQILLVIIILWINRTFLKEVLFKLISIYERLREKGK